MINNHVVNIFYVIIIQIIELSLFPLYGLIARNTAYLIQNR